MLKTEIASLMQEEGRVFEWATKVNNKANLDAEEKEMSEVIDAFAKEIGEKGIDKDNLIAEFIKKSIEPEVYNTDDALLSAMFNTGGIGEFDEKEYEKLPKNTLKAYTSVRGGNVRKSFLDPSIVLPTTEKIQIETSIKYSDLRKNGFKSVAKLTQYAEEALKNEMFFRIFNAVDGAIVGSDVAFPAGGAVPTIATMDNLATYLSDRGANPMAIGLNKYINGIPGMSGFTSFLSEDMKNAYNRYGKLDIYKGTTLLGISGARETGLGKKLIPDQRIFGIADKIGDLDMQGELRIYETPNNNTETIDLKFTGFDFVYAIYHADKMCKVIFS